VSETNKDNASALALGAIGWILGDDTRASRFLALTGLVPDDLRMRITSADVLDAALGFLEAHQPDFLACADALGVPPLQLVQARALLCPQGADYS
jgi:Protein of unknown function (DUF3572)